MQGGAEGVEGGTSGSGGHRKQPPHTQPHSRHHQHHTTIVTTIVTDSLWNIGFTLAFFTMARGVLFVTDTPRDKEAHAPLAGITATCAIADLCLCFVLCALCSVCCLPGCLMRFFACLSTIHHTP